MSTNTKPVVLALNTCNTNEMSVLFGHLLGSEGAVRALAELPDDRVRTIASLARCHCSQAIDEIQHIGLLVGESDCQHSSPSMVGFAISHKAEYASFMLELANQADWLLKTRREEAGA